MFGAIAGDIIGSIYENVNKRSKDFSLFSLFKFYTDDTVLTIATLYAIQNNISYQDAYKKFFFKHPFRGYGPRFIKWCLFKNMPTDSIGNGCAMRVSPIGFLYNSIDKIKEETIKSVTTTHNSPQGIKGSTAVATLIYYAKKGYTKEQLQEEAEKFYDLNFSIDELRKTYKFNATCEGSVPQAIKSFLVSTSFEDAIRTAVSIGGDTDTIASIAGALAEAYYQEIPEEIVRETIKRLPKDFVEILKSYYKDCNYIKF